MRTICIVIASCLPVCGLAQVVAFSSSGGGGSNGTYSINGSGAFVPGTAAGGRAIGIGSLQPELRLDPPYSVVRGLTFSYRGHSIVTTSYFTRTITDSVSQELYGYEVVLEAQGPGAYLATFGKVPFSAMEAASSNWRNWKVRVLALPEPRIVHDGDVISIELMTDPATGQKLFEDVKIGPYVRPLPPGLAANGLMATSGLPLPGGGRGASTVPAVEGTARDFTAADAEMQIRQPRVTLNGLAQSTAGRGPAVTNGSLIWFYLPGRGRYILSLAPRRELDFQKAGEVRGGSIKFTLGEDTITLECPLEIASGHAPYVLYALRDPFWEPTAQAQKGQFAIGSVDAGELVKLKNQ